MVTLAIPTSPASVIRDVFRAIPEVEEVYLAGSDELSAMIVIDGKNYDALRRIFESESVVQNAVPGTSVNFDVVIRDGRPLGDVVNPRGKLLFQR